MQDDKTKKTPVMATYSTRPNRLAKTPSFNWRPAKPKIDRRRLVPALVAVIVFFGVALGGGWLGAYLYQNNRSTVSSTSAKQQYISDESDLIASIAKNVGQSVVSVDVQSQVTGQDFFGFAQTQNQESAGTGFIIDSNGTIVTNRHVVPAGTQSVSVTLADGTTYNNVQVIGRTANSDPLDVAFLKIPNLNGKKLTPVTFGNSANVQVGDRVVAIGNALGQFQNTVTSGIISGYGRDVTAGDQTSASSENLTDLFQTDAAINEGNSGGPLVNINGEVIGLNTATAAGAQNIGFAIPINDIKGLISSVLSKGQLQQSYLGVRYISLTNDLASQFNLKVTRGAYITSGDTSPAVIAGSPAEKAGLKDKDVITKVNNVSIDDKTNLTGALAQFQPGDKVTLTVVRGGKTITISVTLGTAPTG
jgi:S1-C subfamily serine protease